MKTTKTFNVIEDQKLNALAVAYVNGDQEAGAEFVAIVEPKLKNFARKQYSELELEDLCQEFMVVAIEKCFDFVEKYNNGKNNIMGLIYTACRRHLIDLGRGDQAEMRNSRMVVGHDEDGEPIYENREVSLQTKVGDEGDSTMSDKVASDQKSVEDLVVDSLNETTLEKVVKDYTSHTKGRNGQIVPLVYKANKEGWENADLEDAIGKVLFAEKGVEPKPANIRKAKQRAIESLRDAILDGKVTASQQLEWEF
jgi:DNA-directed RNA polymerase specialized sigma24 family protein